MSHFCALCRWLNRSMVADGSLPLPHLERRIRCHKELLTLASCQRDRTQEAKGQRDIVWQVFGVIGKQQITSLSRPIVGDVMHIYWTCDTHAHSFNIFTDLYFYSLHWDDNGVVFKNLHLETLKVCIFRLPKCHCHINDLILRGIDSTRCWKHSSEMLVHIDSRGRLVCAYQQRMV